jgi:hypothetical protein
MPERRIGLEIAMPPGGVTVDYLLTGIAKSPVVAAGVATGWITLVALLVAVHRLLKPRVAVETLLWVMVVAGIAESSLYWAGVLNGHAWDSSLPDLHGSSVTIVPGIAVAAMTHVVLWPIGWVLARFLFITRPENQAMLDAELTRTVVVALGVSVPVVVLLRQFDTCFARCQRLLRRDV